VIVGQTPPALHAELIALRDALGLRESVSFTGFREDVEAALAAFDLFALTSDSEGFSIATVQAMASGLPIVATRCGGPEEILEDGRTGVLVDTGSPEQLADAIERLRHDPSARAALGRAARADADARFSLSAQVRSYERLYEAAIRERGARRRWGRGRTR
jgi:glycosyltransferase involved in cell wall biosynthesis